MAIQIKETKIQEQVRKDAWTDAKEAKKDRKLSFTFMLVAIAASVFVPIGINAYNHTHPNNQDVINSCDSICNHLKNINIKIHDDDTIPIVIVK